VKKKYIFNTFAFVLSLGLVLFLIRQITLENIKDNFARLTSLEIALIALAYLATLILRGIRYLFTVNTGGEGKIKFFAFSAIHSFLNHTLPFRLGETSLPFLFRVFTKSGFSTGMFSLIIVRLYDLIAVAIFFLVSFVFTLGSGGNRIGMVPVISAAFILLVFSLMVLNLPRVIDFFKKPVILLFNRLGEKGSEIAVKVDELARKVNSTFERLTVRDKFLRLPLISLAMWFTLYFNFYLVMECVDIKLGLAGNIVASSGAVLTNLLPINGLGSFGTLEAGWTVGYTLFGVSVEDAISTGFIMHIIIVATGLVTSVIGGLFLVWEKRGR
jgi:uncharacterized membrane protein YbhN (UPF0104 family)